MKLSQQSRNLIESTIKQAVGKYLCSCEQTVVTDIYIQANTSSGELVLFDDEDKELASAIIEEWVDRDETDFYKGAETILRSVLSKMKDAGDFEKLSIMLPYSFVLVDDEKETISELILMDDETFLVNDELLKGLDEELNAFLKDLLEH